jgi:hypothetical protein
MHPGTGEIQEFSSMEAAALQGFTEEVSKEEMTDRQKETMRVSPHDNKSVLGKRYTELRKSKAKAKAKRKISKKSKKRNRTR